MCLRHSGLGVRGGATVVRHPDEGSVVDRGVVGGPQCHPLSLSDADPDLVAPGLAVRVDALLDRGLYDTLAVHRSDDQPLTGLGAVGSTVASQLTHVNGDRGSLSLPTGDQVRSPSMLSSTVAIPLSPEKATPETASGLRWMA